MFIKNVIFGSVKYLKLKIFLILKFNDVNFLLSCVIDFKFFKKYFLVFNLISFCVIFLFIYCLC